MESRRVSDSCLRPLRWSRDGVERGQGEGRRRWRDWDEGGRRPGDPETRRRVGEDIDLGGRVVGGGELVYWDKEEVESRPVEEVLREE